MCDQSFLCPIYDQIHVAEHELSAFVRAVTGLYGPEQARLSAEDWLEESDLMNSSPRSQSRNWRTATIAASARLADRVSGCPGNSKCLHSQKENPNVRLYE
jgi:hypothetical protein